MNSTPIPTRWVVACTGHRRLADEGRVAAAIRNGLVSLKARVADQRARLAAISSVAAGVDTLFAEQSIETGIPWLALLPMVEGEFRNDFSEGEWSRAADCLEQAIDVVACSPETRPEILKEPGSRASAYLEAGLRMVDEADLLLAVWDGEPSRGRGGTAEIIDYARSQGKPVLWICSKTGEVRANGWDSFHFHDALMDDLHALPAPRASAPVASDAACGRLEAGSSGDRGRKMVMDLYERADRAAISKRWSHRSLMIWTLILQSCSVVLVPMVLTQGFTAPSYVASALFCVLGSLATLVFLSWQRPQQRQARFRFAAELCRSAHAVWESPVDFLEVWQPVVPEFNRLLTSLRFMRLETQGDRKPDLADPPRSFESFKAAYANERLQDQGNYFRKQLARAKKQGGLEPLAMACSGATALVLVVVLGGALAGNHSLLHSRLLLIPALAPVLSSTLISLAILNDVKRRKVRYGAIIELITSAEKRLANAQTAEALRLVAEPVERALLAEAREWYYLALHSTGK